MKLYSSLCLTCTVAAVSAFVAPTANRIPTKLSATTSDEAGDDRRSFLFKAAAASASLALGSSLGFPTTAHADGVDYKAVSADISKLVKDDPDKGPTLVRLAWHSSGTYDKMSKTGGSGGGTIRFKEELAHGGNAGLAGTAVKWMEPIHAKYADAGLSYADLYTLAGGKSKTGASTDGITG